MGPCITSSTVIPRLDRGIQGILKVLDSGPFDRPFDKLMVLSEVEGLTALSKVERLRRNDKILRKQRLVI